MVGLLRPFWPPSPFTIELSYELGVRGLAFSKQFAQPFHPIHLDKCLTLTHKRTNSLRNELRKKKEHVEEKKNLFQQSDTLLLCWVALSECSATTKPLSYYFITITWDPTLTCLTFLVSFWCCLFAFSCSSRAALAAAIRTDRWQCIFLTRSVWFAVSREYLYKPEANLYCGERRITHTHEHGAWAQIPQTWTYGRTYPRYTIEHFFYFLHHLLLHRFNFTLLLLRLRPLRPTSFEQHAHREEQTNRTTKKKYVIIMMNKREWTAQVNKHTKQHSVDSVVVFHSSSSSTPFHSIFSSWSISFFTLSLSHLVWPPLDHSLVVRVSFSL